MPTNDQLNYEPKPIDTSHVKLSDDLLKLVELLAKNAHKVWARKKLEEGWHYGPINDDQRREHPSLVPYEQLPDSEKSYDLEIVLETLKAVIVMGYRISKN